MDPMVVDPAACGLVGLASDAGQSGDRAWRPSVLDMAAADQLACHHVDVVSRFCRSRTRSESDAQDAVQNTFLRYLQCQDRDQILNVEAWLIRAASRACLDLNRRCARDEGQVIKPSAGEATSPSPEAVVVSNLLMAELFKALPPQDALLLVRLYLYSLPPAQVAREMGVPAGTVRGMAFRARRRAREILARLEAPPSPTPTPDPPRALQLRVKRAPRAVKHRPLPADYRMAV
jgi:RNA polymerase sigma-70 factor, ECF subfamily